MGVGAIFIATLAKVDLPLAARENTEPKTQTELLASTIQPIVAFMVLCSVVCRTFDPFVPEDEADSEFHSQTVFRFHSSR
jgi:hypothetical protein